MKQKIYSLIESNLNILIKGDIDCMAVISPAGLGKSTTVLETLKKRGLKQNMHYLYRNAHITALSFYQTLIETLPLHKPQLLVLDDVEEMLTNTTILSLLKAATWSSGGLNKTVCFSSNHPAVKNKQSIQFTGKIILLLNEIPTDNPHLRAIIDRSLITEFSLNNQEILEIMRTDLIPKPYKNLDYGKRLKIWQFISRHCQPQTQLSFRVLIKAYNNLLYAPQNWQDLTLSLLRVSTETKQSVQIHNQGLF